MKTDGERIAVLEAQGRWQAVMLEKMDGKIDALISWRWKMTGIVSLAGFIGASLTTFLIELFVRN